MFDSLKGFLHGGVWPPTTTPKDQLALAVAALLVEAARRDDHFDPEERSQITQILRRAYGLTPEAAAELLGTAERANAESTQLYPFTHVIVERMAPEDRVHVIEMLWETVYADGILSPDEDTLIRQIAGLIFVSDRERADAHRRVLQRLGM